MSDFDKEAEREKLREKYGQEEEQREATEQMSELLLKGATMTNAHCTNCGDPIFRYDGQEFCPTCQKPVAREQGSADGDADEQGDHIEVTDPSDDATVQFGAEAPDEGTTAADEASSNSTGAANAPDTATRQPAAADDTTRTTPSVDPDRTPDPATGEPTAPDSSTPTDGVATDSDPSASTPTSPTASQRGSAGPTDNSVTADLSAAESLLAETVHRFAQRAADTEDPRTASEQLKAAREAAETLDAVRF